MISLPNLGKMLAMFNAFSRIHLPTPNTSADKTAKISQRCVDYHFHEILIALYSVRIKLMIKGTK